MYILDVWIIMYAFVACINKKETWVSFIPNTSFGPACRLKAEACIQTTHGGEQNYMGRNRLRVSFKI